MTTKKIWDSLMKRLVQTNPQEIITWISPNAVYEGELNTELQKDPIRADQMYLAMRKGRRVVFHIEFQKTPDDNMGQRVWDYNVLTYLHTRLPVYSVVIYLVEEGPIVEPPYTIDLSDDETVHHFMFHNVKLWEIPPEILFEQNLLGLLPLLPLTKGGNRREVVQQMLSRLQQADKKELLAIGRALAELMLKEIDQQWLEEVFMSMEIDLEGTRMYKEIHQKGLEQGIEQGVQAQRVNLVNVVKALFPNQLALAEQQVGFIKTLPQGQELLDKVLAAHTDEKAQAILLSIPHV